MGTPTVPYKPGLLSSGEVTVYKCCKINVLFFHPFFIPLKISFKYSFTTNLTHLGKEKTTDTMIALLHYVLCEWHVANNTLTLTSHK